ncbi:MAG TPA: substrate-binding domain-containing protein [Candidatus Sulfotelmatobacter sp.]|nr:substrate-binding domain-containing protein [Candidatus Sulfotelmatobacter sp.]
MRSRLLIVCALLMGVTSLVFATDFAVIVHPSNPVRSMALAELGKIFKGKSGSWPTGRNITLILREPNSSGMKFVIERVMGTGAEEGKAILNDSTKKSGVSVVFVVSDEEVVKAVEASPGALGIVDVYNISGGVKVIKIDDKQPFDPGYVLKGH